MAKAKDILAIIKEKVDKFLNPPKTFDDSKINAIPAEVNEGDKNAEKDLLALVDYVKALWDEATQYVNDEFTRTSQYRIGTEQYGKSPETYRNACDKLEAGNIWEVYGRRNTAPQEQWKQERVVGIIGKQMRVRRRHIVANWHDILIEPNIEHINEIIDQEREQNGWGIWINTYAHMAQLYGHATTRLIFDRGKREDGIVRPIVMEPGSFVRTPNSTSLEFTDGCFYAIHATTINSKQVESEYSNLDIEELTISDANVHRMKYDFRRSMKGTYAHTKIYDKLELFMDDPTLEKLPFTELEQETIHDQNVLLLDGRMVKVSKDENHPRHIAARIEEMETALDVEPSNAEEENQLFNRAEAFSENISGHMEMMQENDLASMGLRKKYPHGRYIAIVGDKPAQDLPNPFQIGWRRLFEEVKNEEVIRRMDGRSDPEILWHREKSLSTMVSRIDDLTLSSSIPKKYFLKEDKAEITQNQDDNDPLKPGFVQRQPPVFVKSEPPASLVTMYQFEKEEEQTDLGVNKISIGAEPAGTPSGFQVQLLQRQNQILITGELDSNLRLAITNIVESMMQLYKVLYRTERQYFIEGNNTKINVSEILSFQPVVDPKSGKTILDENGEPQLEPIEKFEVKVKPFSNYPNRFETDLAFFLQLSDKVDEQGLPIIPPDAILDLVATRYPEFGQNGKYRKLSRATEIGLAVLKQEQEAQEQEQKKEEDLNKTIDGVRRQFTRKALVEQLTPEGGENGERQTRQTTQAAA